MAKKIWYSRPLSQKWSDYNTFYNSTHGTLAQFIQERNRQLITYMRLGQMTTQDAQIDCSVMDMWKLDYGKKFTHLYFKNQELKTFLCNTKIADLQGIIDFIYENGDAFFLAPSIDGKTSLGEESKIHVFTFGIHVPYENKEKGYAFQFQISANKSLDLIWSWKDKQGVCTAENYQKNLNSDEDESSFLADAFRLAVNTIAYMKAFPDCVSDGVPATEEQECSYSIDISEKVLDSIQNKSLGKAMAPHFRKGYFKVLRSEFYSKEKRGQMIFVSETMVNGSAKTVEKSEDSERISKFMEGKND